MKRRTFDGPPCPHMPHIYNTEAAHLAHNEHDRKYYERKIAERGLRQFEADGYPLRLRLQRMLANIRYRCRQRDRYAGRGIHCSLTFDDLLFLWKKDNADKLMRASIDRIDNDGHYDVGNVRFIELSENVRLGAKVRMGIWSSHHVHVPALLRPQSIQPNQTA